MFLTMADTNDILKEAYGKLATERGDSPISWYQRNCGGENGAIYSLIHERSGTKSGARGGCQVRYRRGAHQYQHRPLAGNLRLTIWW